MTAETTRSDLCVIGGGTAGHALALGAAAIGARCTLIDPRERLGAGQAADHAEAALIAAAHAHWRAGTGQPFDLGAFRGRLGATLADLAPEHAADRLRTLGVRVIRAEAAFADRDTIMAGGTAIRAARIVIATGGTGAPPGWASALPPARLLRPAALALGAALPEHVAVVAHDPVGLAWAQALRRLGCAVTLVAAPGLRGGIDPELLRFVHAALRRDGVALHPDAEVVGAAGADDRVQLHLSTAAMLTVTAVAVAGSPVPATAGLALDRAGVPCRANGAPLVDAGLRTRNRRILALGDVLGVTWPGGAAVPHQVGLVLRAALFRQPVRFRPERVPLTLRTEPSLAQVGVLVDEEAGSRPSLRYPIAGHEGALGGVVKIVATPGGRVRGAGLVGPGAAEAIQPWTLAVTRNLRVDAVAGLPAPPGGFAEASGRAGLGRLMARLGSPAVRRLRGLLGRLP